MDPDQTALGPHCLLQRCFLKGSADDTQQMTHSRQHLVTISSQRDNNEKYAEASLNQILDNRLGPIQAEP